MGLTYAKHFAESPFAYHGAPSGTTSRLRSWCWKAQIGWVFEVGAHDFQWQNLFVMISALPIVPIVANSSRV